MAAGRLAGRLGLLFAALSGVGAASIVGSLLRGLPQAPAIAAQSPFLLIAAPIPIGALVAIAHIFWLRKLLVRPAPTPADSAPPPRTLVPPPGEGDGGDKPPRWRPVIR